MNLIPYQYHLSKYPLYSTLKSNEETLRILIIGFEEENQRLLDLCLELAQNLDNKLEIDVLNHKDSDAVQTYLHNRTALKDFFGVTIDQTIISDSTSDSYGSITFRTVKNSSLVDEICSLIEEKRFHYVLVNVENGEEIIRDLEEYLGAADSEALISYTTDNENPFKSDKIIPLKLEDSIITDEWMNNLKRMAFNTHLVWNKNLNFSFEQIINDLKNPYNFESSLALALSIQYKLKNFGIDLQKTGFEEAAKQFDEIISDFNKAESPIFNLLIYNEHKRWVVEKITQGWIGLKSLDSLKSGENKVLYKSGKVKGEHICIVKSEPNQKLTLNFENWDKPAKDLDPLDLMSVKEHKYWKRLANQLFPVQQHPDLTEIERLLINKPIEYNRFYEWKNLLLEIEEGPTSKLPMYASLKEGLLNAIKDEDLKEKVIELVSSFDQWFLPIYKSREFKDYKFLDTKIISSIPFILTYSGQRKFVVPFGTENNDAIFSNIASALLAHPNTIVFVALLENKKQSKELIKSFRGVKRLLEKKNGLTNLQMILLEEGLSDQDKEFLTESLQLEKIIWINKENISEAIKALKQEMESLEPFFLEKNDTPMSLFMQGSGFYEIHPWFHFNQGTLTFDKGENTQSLNYIQKNPILSVTDMLELTASLNTAIDRPGFAKNYQKLWKIYFNDPGYWKSFTKLIKEDLERQELVFSQNWTSSLTEQTRTFTLPVVHVPTLQKLLYELEDYGFLAHENYKLGIQKEPVLEITGNFKVLDVIEQYINSLFMINEEITYESVATKSGLHIKYPVMGSFVPKRYKRLLDLVMKEGLIENITWENGEYSFDFKDANAKEILSNEGKLLEVYTYQKVKSSGIFDDVVTSFEIDWEGSGVTNEFDSIVMKGFQSLFIECKATNKIKQDYYYKLASIAKQLGINAKMVLVADTQENKIEGERDNNKLQRTRGDQMDIVTVWKPKDLTKIDMVLQKYLQE